MHEQSQNTATRRSKRTDPQVRRKEQAEDTAAHQVSRAKQQNLSIEDVDIVQSINKLRSVFAHGPVFICVCCNRSLYRHSVSKFTRQKYHKNATCAANLLSCVPPCVTTSEWICQTCNAALLHSKMPAQATCNNLAVPAIPSALANLTDLESRLIAKRLLFMKIFKLPKGAHQGIKGSVVNVPADVTKIASVLPRVPSQSGLIGLKLKRDLKYKSAVSSQTIRPQVVLYALAYLVQNNPSHYGDVTVNTSWIDDSVNDDSELWTALVEPDTPSDHDVTRTTEQECETETGADRGDVADRGVTITVEQECDTESVVVGRDAADCGVTMTVELQCVAEPGADRGDVADDGVSMMLELECETESVAVGAEDVTDHGMTATDEQGCDSDDEDELSPSMDSCLQPTEGPVSSPEIISLAPSQGQTPLSLFTDKDSEFLAFPKLFPSGTFGHATQRQTRLTLRKYFNARLLNTHTRFSESLEYLFYAQYMTEAQQVMQSISIALRKSKPITVSGLPLTAATFKSPDSVSEIVKFDEEFRVLKSVRGSPAYWQTMQFDMLAKIKQLGPFTWFVTLSVADMKWTELIRVVCDFYGETKSDEEIANMSWSDRCHYIKRNPVLVARHVDYMFHKLFRTVMLSSPHPVSKILDYEVKKEFQARGAVHFHMAIWVEDSPKLDEDDDAKVIDFIDKHVSCSVPDDSESLARLVTELQTHSHTRSCKRNSSCRFGFPRPPSPRTVISRKADTPELLSSVKTARELLTKVYTRLTEWDGFQPLTTEALVNDCGLSLEQYTACLQLAASKTTIHLKRSPQERCVNNYNPFLLSHWQANMDIQYVTDPYACVMYIVS